MNEARRVLSFIFRGRQYGYRLDFFEMIFFSLEGVRVSG